jgi:uncharacterized repeat protein (TIGR01451 family)
LLIVVTVDAGTSLQKITNTASITNVTQPDPDDTNDSDSMIIIPGGVAADLAVSKVVSDDTPDEAQIITYTITVDNNGPSPATGIIIGDELPGGGVDYVSHSASQGSYSSSNGNWDLVTPIASGAQATLTIDAELRGGTAGFTFTNTACVLVLDQADPVGSNDCASADITVNTVDLAVSKIVDNATPDVGATVEYTVTIDNLGPGDATGVELSDIIPSGVSHDSHTASQGSYSNSIWTAGDIASGNVVTLTLRATVDAGTGGQTITNTARIVALDQTDPVAGNDLDQADIIVAPL